MDSRAPERARQTLLGLVISPSRGLAGLRVGLISAVAFSLLSGIAGGLVRAGVFAPGVSTSAWLRHAVIGHAALMICGVFGTVIAAERAVASRLRLAFLAPLASAAGSIVLLSGQFTGGAWLICAAAAVFLFASLVLVRRQFAAHTLLLAVGSLCWLVGSFRFTTASDSVATIGWWFAFLILTIAAERLEMTRLMPQRVVARACLLAVLAALLAGAFATEWAPSSGGLLFGAALSLLALWLCAFDIARRTVLAHGLSRYMALCLICGYVWLFVAGLAWGAMAVGWPARDIALHAIGLGFIFSMVMGHAPIILPAVARITLHFAGYFYLPLVALHFSLLLRLAAGPYDDRLHTMGVTLNAFAIGLFALTIAISAIAWRTHRVAAGHSEAAPS